MIFQPIIITSLILIIILLVIIALLTTAIFGALVTIQKYIEKEREEKEKTKLIIHDHVKL